MMMELKGARIALATVTALLLPECGHARLMSFGQGQGQGQGLPSSTSTSTLTSTSSGGGGDNYFQSFVSDVDVGLADAVHAMLHIHSHNHNNDDDDDPNSRIVESFAHDDDDFFHEDFWYTFQPLPLVDEDDSHKHEHQQHHQHQHERQESTTTKRERGGDGSQRQRWKIQRVPKKHNDGDGRNRKLQQQQLLMPVEAEEQHQQQANKPFNSDNGNEGNENDGDDEKNYMFYVTNILLSLSCVLMAALAAGLTMGMLSLDPLSLEIKRRASTSNKEKQWSEQLLPLLVGHSKRHRLLVSLLLLNSLANEALPLFLDELFPSKYAAIIVSVTLVLFFGEIVPSAFFTGPDQVEVAAKLVPLVNTVMFLLTPIAVPIARVLDRVLHDDSGGGHGHEEVDEEDVTEGNYYNRTELGALVRIQYESQMADKRRRRQERHSLLLTKLPVGELSEAGGVGKIRSSTGVVSSHISAMHNNNVSLSSRESVSGMIHTHHSIRSISNELTATSLRSATRMPSIHRDEITMIEGALAMTTKRAADVCTPLRRVYALPTNTVLDEETKVEIWARGYSRVPVYRPKAAEAAESTSSDGTVSKPTHRSSSSIDDIDVSGIVGVLLVRQLIVIDSDDERPISTLPLVQPTCISPSMHLVDVINMFQAGGGRGKGGLHLAIVCAHPHLATEALVREEPIPKNAGVVGIITLEDVVEELLQEEIYDEADRDLELSRWGILKWMAFVKRQKLKRLQMQRKSGVVPSSGGVTETISEQTPLLK